MLKETCCEAACLGEVATEDAKHNRGFADLEYDAHEEEDDEEDDFDDDEEEDFARCSPTSATGASAFVALQSCWLHLAF